MIVFVLAAAGAIIFAFRRPRGVFRFAGIALLSAIVLPFALAYALDPLVGEGAGMGIAFILYALSAMIATLAVFAALGAGLRHGWNALR
jgi:hypothetical protein